MSELAFVSAVILESPDAERLAQFYIDFLDVPLKRAENHGVKHFECELGDVHFAIFPIESSSGEDGTTQRVRFALAVADLSAKRAQLDAGGVPLLYPPVDRGFALMTAVRDPDGNLVELTELSAKWLQYLNSRDEKLRDITKQKL